MGMTGHVRGGVEADKKAGPGDDQAKEQAQAVEAKPQVQVQARYPGPLEFKHPPVDHLGPEIAEDNEERQRQCRTEQSQTAAAGVMVVAVRIGCGHFLETGKAHDRPI